METKRKQQTTIAESKDQIRRSYKRKRDAMPASLVSQLSVRISEKIFEWEVYQQAERMFFYYPLGNEVSLLPVIQEALRRGKQIAFPKTAGDSMEFYEITNLAELKEGQFHVMEPDTESKHPVCWNPQICFVPGIVFDLSGGRFGYGGGYYDRYFAKKDQVKLVGCAYGFQIVDRLPISLWDVRLEYVLSENGIIYI